MRLSKESTKIRVAMKSGLWMLWNDFVRGDKSALEEMRSWLEIPGDRDHKRRVEAFLDVGRNFDSSRVEEYEDELRHLERQVLMAE